MPFGDVVVLVVLFVAHEAYSQSNEHQQGGDSCTHTSYYPTFTCKERPGERYSCSL